MKALKTIKPSKIDLNANKAYILCIEEYERYSMGGVPQLFVASGKDIIKQICKIFDYKDWLKSDDVSTDPKKALKDFLKWVENIEGDGEDAIYIYEL